MQRVEVSADEQGASPGDAVRLQRLVRNGMTAGQVGFWEWNALTNRVHYTAAVARLFGLPPSQQTDGVFRTSILDAVHPEDRADVARNLDAISVAGGFMVQEYRTVSASGQVHLVRAQGVYERDMQGVFVRSCGAIIDLTADGAGAEAMLPVERLANAIHEVSEALGQCPRPIQALLRPPLGDMIARFRRMVHLLKSDEEGSSDA